MRKYLLAAFVFGILLIPFFALAESPERITDFSAKYIIQPDASVSVREVINYDFGYNNRHGIYRDIPESYKKSNTQNRYIKIQNVSVTDSNGLPQTFTKQLVGKNIRIKIGDPEQYVRGKRTYVITYKVIGAINYFSDHDELYMNVTGTGWQVPIDMVSAELTYPPGTTNEGAMLDCFSGSFGSKQACNSAQISETESGVAGLLTATNLSGGQGLTFVAGFPKGKVAYAAPIIGANLIYYGVIGGVGLLIALVTLTLLIVQWFRTGRDPKGRGVYAIQYDPPHDLSPAEAGTIDDNRVEKRLLAAEIMWLATNGYIKITHEKIGKVIKHDNFIFEIIKKLDEKVPVYTKDIFEYLMSYNAKYSTDEIKKEKKTDMRRKWQNFERKVYNILVRKGYYRSSPGEVKLAYGGAATTLLMIIFLSFVLAAQYGLVVLAVLTLPVLFLYIFSFIMSPRTIRGVEAKEYLLGLREYIDYAESDRMDFEYAPEKNPQKFEELYPYAIAMGLEKKWAEKFKNIIKESPGWYNDSSGDLFTTIVLIDSMNTLSTYTANAFAAGTASNGMAGSGGSGFGGGGFSGGGFGGGGGGSW